MNKPLKQILFGAAIVILIMILIKQCGIGIADYFLDPSFKTDTVWVDKPYALPKDSFPYKVPAKVIIRYRDSDDEGRKVDCKSDSLLSIIDSLGIEITSVNTRFLTLHPNSSKLVYALFKRDTLQLDLLNLDGDIQTNLYPVDYSKYKYQYLDGSLRADRLNLADRLPTFTNDSTKKRKLTTESYISPIYMVFDRKIAISADYSVNYKRLRLGGEILSTLEKQPNFGLRVKLGYKLK